MFGFKVFDSKGQDNYTTPEKFHIQAREDINNHLKNFRKKDEHIPTTSKTAKTTDKSTSASASIINESLKYGSSPLRKAVTISSLDQDSSDDASIDSLDRASTNQLSKFRTNNSTIESSSLFTNNHLAAIYTNTTLPSTVNNESIIISNNNNFNGYVHLNDVLPKSFNSYYSSDLKVDKFSNGRPKFTKRNLKNWELNDIRSLLIIDELKPEWNNKIPKMYKISNIDFRINYLPLNSNDSNYIEVLISSDIYKESKFNYEFKLKTATFILQKARKRHYNLLTNNFHVPADLFDSNYLLHNNYDDYFKFEWRNIIENYLLNLAIENQCRYEFKLKINSLKKLRSNQFEENNLYKKVLSKNRKFELNDDLKFQIWQEIQKNVYKNLNLDSLMDGAFDELDNQQEQQLEQRNDNDGDFVMA